MCVEKSGCVKKLRKDIAKKWNLSFDYCKHNANGHFYSLVGHVMKFDFLLNVFGEIASCFNSMNDLSGVKEDLRSDLGWLMDYGSFMRINEAIWNLWSDKIEKRKKKKKKNG